MATAPTTAPATAAAAAETAAAAPEAATEAASPVPAGGPADKLESWNRLIWLPCSLEVELNVPHVTVGDILRLQVDSVVETRWQQNADVPIRASGQLIAWAEFEGVDEKLAVRVTRIA